MLPQLSHVFAAFDKLSTNQEETTLLHREIAVTSIVASRYSNKSWKMNCIARATKALKVIERSDLDAELAYRESSLLRMAGKFEISEKRLKEFEQAKAVSEDTPLKIATRRHNAQCADIIISFAENLIYQERFQDAIAELKRWEPLQPSAPSTLESIALRARNITLGKVLRYQGQFKYALEMFTAVLNKSLSDDFFEGSGWYRVLLSNLADLNCELGKPEKGEDLLQKELEPMYKNGTQNIATGRRLQLSLVEIFIQSARHDSAKELLSQLERQYCQENYSDLSTYIYLFQVYIGMARIFHYQSKWDEALRYWRLALASTHDLTLAEDRNIVLVQISIAYILHRKGDISQSHSILNQLEYNKYSECRIYWIAGFNSLWHDYIKRSLDNECNCKQLYFI